MNDPSMIKIQPWEYEYAYHIGIRRFTENWGRQDASYYDRSKMEEDRNAQAAAALCELAVAKYLNQYWHASIWRASAHNSYKQLADVGEDIEVRRVRTAKGVTVRKKDLGKRVWGAACADSEFRRIKLLGYIDAKDALANTAKDIVVVPINKLLKPWKEGDFHKRFD
jgi:hypothetical protein